MKKKVIKETDLYARLNVLLMDKQKDSLDNIKENLSLIANVSIDNSAFFRSVVEYFSSNPEKLTELKEYFPSQLGEFLVNDVVSLINAGETNEAIYEKIGIGEDKLNQCRESLK